MFFELSIAAVLLGAIIGSFLNALSFRLNTGRGMGGRSRCMHCGHTLRSLDLVPLLSFVFLRGRCRYCRARISFQYPAVELAAALLSLAVYTVHPEPLAFAFWFLVWMTLLFVVMYDLRHYIILWSCSGLLAILAFISLFVSSGGDGAVSFAFPTVFALLAGPLLALPLTLFSLVSGGRWMGWGDGALELSLGWFLGLSFGATALMLAFWIGAAVGLLLLALTKRYTIRSEDASYRGRSLGKESLFSFLSLSYTMNSELPFAPFLILGALIVYFTHVDFFSSIALLW